MNKATITVVTETQEFALLKGVWDSLLQKYGKDKSIYLTHEWLSNDGGTLGKEINCYIVN